MNVDLRLLVECVLVFLHFEDVENLLLLPLDWHFDRLVDIGSYIRSTNRPLGTRLFVCNWSFQKKTVLLIVNAFNEKMSKKETIVHVSDRIDEGHYESVCRLSPSPSQI